ncbi:MAG: DUF4397 domain-containing protein [Chitinophagaceae bacterium]|nr:MAG: DUF4397 domain-containing protein [Chitinophagaceae bacterium]
MKKAIFGLALLVGVAVACKKTDTIPERYTAVPAENTYFRFINVAPGTPAVNFFVNGEKISGRAATGTGATTGVGYGVMFPVSTNVAYASVPAGNLKVDAKVIDSSTVMPGALILSRTQGFNAGQYYTFVLLDTVTQATALIVEDSLGVAIPTKAYVRIANFTADSAFNMQVTKTTTADFAYTKTFANIPQKSVTAFDTLTAGGSQTYKFDLRRTTNNAIVATLTGFVPNPAKKYTIYVGGLLRTPQQLQFGSYTLN